MNGLCDNMAGGSGEILCQNVQLRPVVSITDTLVSLVQGMLGPCGQQTLLSTHTGKVLVTRDGWTVLSALHLAHPLARCIMQSLRSYHSEHNDGSKTFILYLSQMLKAIENHLQLHGNSEQNRLARIKLSLELNQFLRTDFKQIVKLFMEKVNSCTAKEAAEDFLSSSRNILKTSLGTCVQKQLVHFFTDLLDRFLGIGCKNQFELEQCLSHVLQYFDMYHTKVSIQPQQKSRICEGILLEADLRSVCETGTDASLSKTKNFVLMDFNFDEAERQSVGNTVWIQPSTDSIADFLTFKRTAMKKVLTSLKSARVDVILHAETVPQYFAGLCKEEVIAVRCLSTERLTFLCDVTGVSVLKELNQEALRGYVFTANIDSFVHIGNKVCTMIKLSEKSKRSPFISINHMVMCAPTEGLCDQLCLSLYKAVKSLHACQKPCGWVNSAMTECISNVSDSFGQNCVTSVSERVTVCDINCVANKSEKSVSANTSNSCVVMDGIKQICADRNSDKCHADSVNLAVGESSSCVNKGMLTISSGGAFEALLVSTITDYFASQNSHPGEGIEALIKEMLTTVPRTLHTNLCSSSHQDQRQLTEKWTCVLAKVCEGRLAGLDLHGDVCDVTHSSYVEPVSSKLSLVAHVLQLVIQLVRVDAIVPVRRLPVNSAGGSEEEEEP